MVPENHEIVLPGTRSLREFFKSEDFLTDVRKKLRTQYEVDLLVLDGAQVIDDADEITEERLQLSYTPSRRDRLLGQSPHPARA